MNKIFSYTEVEEGYPMYVLNGCAVGLDYYLEETDNDVNACNVQRDYAEKNIASDTIVDEYNDYCKSLTGELEVKYDGLSCSDAKNLIIDNYLDYSSLYNNWYKTNCEDKTGIISLNDIDKADYNNVPGNCERKRIFNDSASSFDDLGFTGVIRSKTFDSINECGYPLFYVNGWATSFDYYKQHLVNNGTEVKDALKDYCNEIKNEVLGYVDTVDSKVYSANYDYNLICVDTGVTEKINSHLLCNYKNTSDLGSEVYQVSEVEKTGGVTDTSSPLYKATIAVSYKNLKNVHGYKYPAFVVQGAAWSMESIINADGTNACINDDFKRAVCSVQREYIMDNSLDSDKNLVNKFNELCIDTGIVDSSKRISLKEYVKIVFSANNAYGMECQNGNHSSGGINYTVATTANNECTYYFDKAKGGSEVTINVLPKTDNLKQYTTFYDFSGWKRTSDTECKTGFITLTLPTDLDEVDYVACFQKDNISKTGYSLYNNCDGNFVNGQIINNASGIKEIKDESIQNVNLDNTGTVKSNIVTKHDYINMDSSVSQDIEGFMLNKFCKISCTENFNYYYPTIFQTAKSGTYFDLLGYPSINSWLTCTETFNYDIWKNAYETSIEEEKKAYVNKMNDAKIDGWSSTSSESTTSCGGYCAEDCSWPSTGCCDYVYYDLIKLTDSMLKYNVETKSIDTESYTYSKCENLSSSHLEDAKSEARTNYGINSSTDYGEEYKAKVDERKNIEKANIVCVNAMKSGQENDKLVELKGTSADEITKKSIIDPVITNNFYNVTPKMYFYYESDIDENAFNFVGDSNSYYEEELGIKSSEIVDTGAHDWESEILSISDDKIEFSYGGTDYWFEAKKTANTFQRSVTRTYFYGPANSHPIYYSSKHTGNIQSGSGDIYLGYVYPIKLTLSGTRNVYFAIDANTNLNYGAIELLKDKPNSVTDRNVYKCDYDVINDIILQEKDGDTYKKNFYVRSVSTNDVDPNDRVNNGTFGANWADDKGTSLIRIIEEKSKGKNTYNLSNLEYSFTLNAQTIEAIREYNSAHRYDDFNLECNNMGGECESAFLSELAGINDSNKTRVNSYEVNGVNPVIKRESWKYYVNGKWMKTKSITDTNSWIDLFTNLEVPSTNIFNSDGYHCLKGDKKATYDCLYQYINKGVLP